MKKRRKRLVDLDIEAVAGVDSPANRRRWLVIKRDDGETKSGADDVTKAKEASGGMDEELVTAILDFELAKREAANAKAATPADIWRLIEASAAAIQAAEPHLSEDEALQAAVERNPALAHSYNESFKRGEAVETTLAKAQAWAKAQQKAASLQQRNPELSRDDALRQVFSAEPELYRQL